MFDDLGQSIERLRYARNYYKPRRALKTAVLIKLLYIKDDEGNKNLYEVPIPEYNKAVAIPDKDEARRYLISVSKLHVESEEYESF